MSSQPSSGRPPRLAYLFDLINSRGGGGVNAHRLCTEFERDETFDVVAMHGPGTGLPEPVYSTKRSYLSLYPETLGDGLDELDPDVVFMHGYHPNAMEWLREYREDNPDLTMVYRAGVSTVEQWLTLYQHGNPERVTAALADLDCFDALIAPSYAAAERLKLNYGDRCPKLAVAPCTIDYNQYSPTPFLDDDTLRIVMATRIAANNYALAPLLAVRRLVDSELPDDIDIDIEMQILSAGTPGHLQAVNAIVEEIDEIEIVGHVDHTEVPAYLSAADVVCVPTISQQAVPTVAVEAMAAANVVLCAGFHTTNEESALIRMPLDHPPAWYDALYDVMTDRDGALTQIREGIDHAHRYRTEPVVQDAYLPTFEDLGVFDA